MTNDFYSQINSELKNRSQWEDKQAVWFRMRYEGIKRRQKPYDGAPDMHYPLVDTMIEKVKPFYVGQIYGQERIAAFTSGRPQTDGATGLAERLFDFIIKQRTNFERAIYTSIDHMLMYGRGPIKVYWDQDKKAIQLSPIRPIYLIAPHWTEELGDADWLIHVIHMSESQYRRNKSYNKDDAFITQIKGRGGNENGGTTTLEQNSFRRQGITCGEHDQQIVVWEVYSRDGDKILVDTISPIAGPDKPIRETFGLPYKHGQMPFADLRYEITDPDFYAPRGLTEILSQFELDLCKLWNHKLQYLDFFGQPIFENEGLASANPTNFKNEPGRILPAGIKPIQNPGAPLDFEKEMQLQRALAEDRIQVPDLSAGQHLAGQRGAKGGVTATQINALLTQSNGGNDMRSRIFRLQLATLYGQAWSLGCQYLPDTERVLEDFTQVPKEAIHDQYRIGPSGSADSSSKEQRLAKAMVYKQMLSGDPSIKQNELTKWTLEQDDASLVQRLYVEPQDAQLDEAERQAEEIVLMLHEYPAKVHKADDDKVHLTTIAQWVSRQVSERRPISPLMAGMLIQHGQGHAQQIMQKRDKQGIEVMRSLKPTVDYLQSIASQGQQPGQQQQQPSQQPALMNGGGAPALPQAGGQQQPHVAEAINYKDAPPTIRRQMEAQAGMIPASDAETAIEHAANLQKATPKSAPAPAKVSP